MRRWARIFMLVPMMLFAVFSGGCSELATTGTGQPSVADEVGDIAAADSASDASDAASTSTQPMNEEDESTMRSITVTVNGVAFTATLEDTDAAREFAELLPMTCEMSELNGNEKYFYLDERLSADASCPERIEAGDIMLYGGDCLVLFYQSFNTTYSYTCIGHIDDVSGLAAAVDSGSATVTWE